MIPALPLHDILEGRLKEREVEFMAEMSSKEY
jgi:hypothetical protein